MENCMRFWFIIMHPKHEWWLQWVSCDPENHPHIICWSGDKETPNMALAALEQIRIFWTRLSENQITVTSRLWSSPGRASQQNVLKWPLSFLNDVALLKLPARVHPVWDACRPIWGLFRHQWLLRSTTGAGLTVNQILIRGAEKRRLSGVIECQ